MNNLPNLSNRAKQALEVLANGGQFRHGLERNSYTGREQFTYRLKLNGSTIKGVGLAAFEELRRHNLLAIANGGTSVSTYYKLNTAGV